MQATGWTHYYNFTVRTSPYPSAVIFILSDKARAITALLFVTIYSYREGTDLRNCQARKERMEQKQKRCLELQ